jgi:YHS domain-containing protein
MDFRIDLHRRWWPALLALLLLWPALPAAAHGERCPVCGMVVETHDAKWTSDYAGKTYFFCMKADRAAFLSDPEKYAGVLQLTQIRGPHVLILSVNPTQPRPGAAAKCFLKVAKTAPDGMSADEGTLFAVRRAVAHVFFIDRTRPPAPRRIELQPAEQEKLYGLAVFLHAPGDYRIRVEVELEDGPRYTAHFDLHAVHDEAAPSRPTPPSGELSMEAQHQGMKVVGQSWLAIEDLLARPTPDAKELVAELEAIEAWRKVMPQFSLHKFEDQKPEFDRLTGVLGAKLGSLRRLFERKNWTAARNEYRAVDAKQCTVCHLKFRWGVAPDVSRYPDLRRLDYAD